MTNDELLRDLTQALEKSVRIVRMTWQRQSIKHNVAKGLVRQLRRANAAAQGLERRAAGLPAPKLGD